jgi:cytochrome P450
VQKIENFSDDLACYISGTLLEAGSDTTASTLYGFVLAMIMFPDVQKKIWEEIDHVIGSDRLPEESDLADLPYVRCTIKESLRWMPTVILGIPHSVTRDDTYKGYKIPQGATIMNNIWYALRHPFAMTSRGQIDTWHCH